MTENISARIEAIDILRGFSLAFMILVNNPGSWGHVYRPLQHASWHGLTPTDLVFPFFLFVVGASMAFSLRQAITNEEKPIFSIVKRGLIIAGIGLLLHIYATEHPPEHWRYMGVLQRIGLCFIIVGLMVLFVPERWLIPLGLSTLIGYSLILLIFSGEPYSLQHNVVRKVDLAVMGANHMWKGKGVPFDPEGGLSTFSAAVTVLCGYLFGRLLQRYNVPSRQARCILIISAGLTVCGLLLSLFQPVNKYLWTPAFVLVTAGIAGVLLAVIIWLWDIKRFRWGLNSARIYGTNPILIYVLVWLVTVTLEKITIHTDEYRVSVKTYLFTQMSHVVPENMASMLYGLLLVGLFYLLSDVLYRRHIIVKI